MQPFCTIIKKFLKRHSTVIQVSQTPDLVKVCLCSIQVYTNTTMTTQETCWNCFRSTLNRRAYSEFSKIPGLTPRILENPTKFLKYLLNFKSILTILGLLMAYGRKGHLV